MTPRFIAAHATHPDARIALALAAAQLDAQRQGRRMALGWVYLTDHYSAQAEALLAELHTRWPGTQWVGSVGVGILAEGVEYFDEPALALMLADLPADQFQVFNGRQPMAATSASHVAQVHADPATPELAELISELADRTATGYLFGGLASGRGRGLHIAEGVFDGGLSGVAFAPEVALVSRVTQGCQPVGPPRRISAAERNLVLALDDQPALPLLLRDLAITLDEPRRAMAALRATLVGLTDGRDEALARAGQFGADTRVRHLIGLDPQREGVAIADDAVVGHQLAFCRRDVQAARRDLTRIGAEIRDEVESELPVPALSPGRGDEPSPRIAGAIYVSCSGRGGPHFGGPSAEAQIVRRALGDDVPLIGFFAAGEIARHHLYGYTGVLTVFAGR
ncbi:MAG: FIST C-terminal domain-containing protein [Burkholderiales bacterium]|nr:FIST C-terminal domain-containing protein [Burkholderiales bacterium]